MGPPTFGARLGNGLNDLVDDVADDLVKEWSGAWCCVLGMGKN